MNMNISNVVEPQQGSSADHVTESFVIRELINAGKTLNIEWADGGVSRFLFFWLRDNCPQLRHVTTGHRAVETSSIPRDVHPSQAIITPSGSVEITWEHDAHVSTFTPGWLRENDYGNGARYRQPALRLWDGADVGNLPIADYPRLTDDSRIRRDFLKDFLTHGVGILHGVPCEPGTVLAVGALFGEIRSTSWGTVFDVVSKEDANSLAYTNLPLVTHTDEGYRDPAPTVQLQHFLRADASGGESTLVDGFKIAEDMRVECPAQFELLANTILDFHFADDTAEHHASDPILTLRPDGSLKAVRYSNHSVLPFRLASDRMEEFYEAYLTFASKRESDSYQVRLKMGAGDLYMVDNHRVLHGRTGFLSGGARHLQSCYIERDELASRVTMLERSLERSSAVTR